MSQYRARREKNVEEGKEARSHNIGKARDTPAEKIKRCAQDAKMEENPKKKKTMATVFSNLPGLSASIVHTHMPSLLNVGGRPFELKRS